MDRYDDDIEDDHLMAGFHSSGELREKSTGRGRPASPHLRSPRSGCQRRSFGERNLFRFDLHEFEKRVLINESGRQSQVSYREYAVFDNPKDPHIVTARAHQGAWTGEEGLSKFRDALRHGFGLNEMGSFGDSVTSGPHMQGRMRHVIVDRLVMPLASDGISTPDGITLTPEDYGLLKLHSATLPSAQRITVESLFWDSQQETQFIILSFSANPQPPYDFLSMSYNIKERTGTALIRRSFNSRWHSENALEEYEHRWGTCQDRWAHPLVLPVVMLQVQLLSTEGQVSNNNEDVRGLEAHVSALTGDMGRAAALRNRRRTSSNSSFKPIRKLSDLVRRRSGNPQSGHNMQDMENDNYMPPQTIILMKEAHDVLRGAIKLLDTLRWMERAIKLLIRAGSQLDTKVRDRHPRSGLDSKAHQDIEDELDDLSVHWHEVHQYLQYLEGLCQSLETDRRMSELRCRAQIDIIYSKMAQEDNNLNARMAVAATRDSSALKALAVITALFLPGEFISSLFGVSMFNWQNSKTDDSQVIMPLFWVYWVVSIPLTVFTVALWRGWWVNQDRHFRRHLSLELSNERYWTTDGKPRELETTFLQDFFAVFRPNDSSSRSTITGTTTSEKRTMSMDNDGRDPGLLRRGLTLSDTLSMPKDDLVAGDGRRIRSRQLLFSDERACQVV